jgi:uncharacterized protein YecT (DUF1311 family)
MLRLPLAALMTVSLGVPAKQSLAADPPVNCASPHSTPEFNLCAEGTFQRADDKLNAAFAKAIAFIKTVDSEKPYDAASWEQALRASQRAWVAFRDADCKGLTPMSWTGGTGTMVAVLECMTAKTNIRTKELVTIYKGE